MSAEQWTWFWTLVLCAGSCGFGVLALVVAVGGFRDVQAMFRRIDAEHAETESHDPAGGSRSGADSSHG